MTNLQYLAGAVKSWQCFIRCVGLNFAKFKHVRKQALYHGN